MVGPTTRPLNIILLGNLFSVPWATECDIATAFESLGHHVHRLQEGSIPARRLPRHIPRADLLVWIRTADLSAKMGEVHERRSMLKLLVDRMPVIGIHLDRWWDLAREREVGQDPYLSPLMTRLYTADGGNDQRWADVGISHRWMPPGVDYDSCYLGTPRDEYRSEVAFVGNHFRDSYHPESPHRFALVDWLRDTYGDRCAFWPKPGEHAVRMGALNDLLASVDVVVGDSCLVGTGHERMYCSDRCFELPGRGGLLVHPYVEGIIEPDGASGLLWPGHHVMAWSAYDWAALRDTIDFLLANPADAKQIRLGGHDAVRERHTYKVRVAAILDDLRKDGLIP